MKRRDFLKGIAAGAVGSVAAAPLLHSAPPVTAGSDRLGQLLPLRPFARTGESLTLLGVGGMHVGQADDREAQAIIETALEGGVRFFDNAHAYQNGRAEELFGRYLTPKYRDDIFLMTKVKSRTAEETRRQLDESLSRLNTDHIDLWLMHAVTSPKDVDDRLANGVLDAMLEAVDQKKVRYLGFSGHSVTSAHLRLLEKLGSNSPMVSCLLPISPVDAVSADSFTELVVPELNRLNYAPLAMKTLNAGHAFKEYRGASEPKSETIVPGRISLEENFFYVLSSPICSWVSGMPSVANLRTNLDLTRRFTSLTEGDRLAITTRVAGVADVDDLEKYKVNPGWSQPPAV